MRLTKLHQTVLGSCILLFGMALPFMQGIWQPTQASTPAEEVTNLAHHELGAAYSYSGTNPYTAPKTGFTCVTFVQWVFHEADVHIPMSGGLPALYSYGTPVAKGNLQPGDMVFFAGTYAPGLSHVAIYVGSGDVIGADNPSVGVHEDTIMSGYWAAHYAGARRVPALADNYATYKSTAVQSQWTGATGNATVKAWYLNVRSGPGVEHSIIGVASRGQEMHVIRTVDGWSEINWNGTTAWVASWWLNF